MIILIIISSYHATGSRVFEGFGNPSLETCIRVKSCVQLKCTHKTGCRLAKLITNRDVPANGVPTATYLPSLFKLRVRAGCSLTKVCPP